MIFKKQSKLKTINSHCVSRHKNIASGIFLMLVNCLLAHSQTVVEIYADYDVALGYHDNFNTADNNYNDATQNGAYCIPGTNGGLNVNRSLIHFDLSEIPANAVISSANLSLYALGAAGTLQGHSGSNNHGLIQRIVEPWEENVVTWNTQPVATEMNEVLMDPSTGPLQDYTEIDLTAMTLDMLASTNFGVLLKLADESPTNVLLFCSADHSNSALHPKLTIAYNLPNEVAEVNPVNIEIELFPNPSNGLTYCQIDNFPASEVARVEILNLQGQILVTSIILGARQSLPTNQLPAGIYIIRFTVGNRTINKKLTIEEFRG